MGPNVWGRVTTGIGESCSTGACGLAVRFPSMYGLFSFLRDLVAVKTS